MRSILVRFAALALCIVAAAVDTSAQARRSGASVPPELQRTWNKYRSAWNQDEPAILARFFADDVVLVLEDDVLRGRTAIVEEWIRPGLDFTSDVELTPIDFAVAQDSILEVGRFSESVRRGDDEREAQGLYTHHWFVQEDGSWKVRSVVVRSDCQDTSSEQDDREGRREIEDEGGFRDDGPDDDNDDDDEDWDEPNDEPRRRR